MNDATKCLTVADRLTFPSAAASIALGPAFLLSVLAERPKRGGGVQAHLCTFTQACSLPTSFRNSWTPCSRWCTNHNCLATDLSWSVTSRRWASSIPNKSNRSWWNCLCRAQYSS